MKRLLMFFLISVIAISGLKAQSNIVNALNGMQKDNKFMDSSHMLAKNQSMKSSKTYCLKSKKQIKTIQLAFQKDRSKANMVMLGTNAKKDKMETLIYNSGNKQKIYTIEYINETNAKITYILCDIKNKNQMYKVKKGHNMKYYIPKNGYININGKHLTLEQAIKEGYDVEHF
jgi:hypothetical protein